jgi:threonine dehydratase/serine racemase
VTTPTIDDVRAASTRIAPHVIRTPVFTSRLLDELAGTHVLLKCETFQRTGSFKARGACNAVLRLDEHDAARGVATHSSGNHAAALAYAASLRAIPAHVVMPATAARVKVDAVLAYGGHIVRCEPTLADRERTLRAVVDETGACVVHPYDDPDVIAGAGTAALELLEDHPEIRLVITPVGGGGLLSGTAIASRALDRAREVWGAEPEAVDDAYRSLESGRREHNDTATSIADGLLTELSDRTFSILSRFATGILRVAEAEIVDAMHLLFTRTKLVVEPSAATALAGVLALARTRVLPDAVGIVLSGANVDPARLPFDREPRG